MQKISEGTFLRADSTELPAIRFSVDYGNKAYNAIIRNGIGYACFFDTGKYSYFKGTPEEIENEYWSAAKDAERFYA
jgi:hypothetical protein